MIRSDLFVLALIASANVAAAQTPTIPGNRAAALTSSDVQQTVPLFVREQLARRKIAGAVVVLVKDGVVLLGGGYGLADVAAQRPMRSDTPVRIGSVTKLLTALAVMRLVDEGRVSLDEDVGRYLDFNLPAAPGGAPVTLRRLLSHQTGFEDRIGGIAADSDHQKPFGEFLAARRVPRLRLGDGVVAYANYNAALAARVVERVSGQSFERYLASHVFEPLGMVRTTAEQPAPDRLQVSSGYVTSDVSPTRVSMAADAILEVGSTGVVTSATDMGRLLRTLLASEPGVVSRRAVDEMTRSQAPVPLGMMGLGMYSPLGAGGNPFVGHDGGTGSFQSAFALLPREGFGLFAAYNSDGVPQPLPAGAELLQFIASRYFGPQRPAIRSTAAIDGTYAPTRGVAASFFKLRQLVQQMTVTSTSGESVIRPAFLPVGQPLVRGPEGAFRWSGRDVAFGTSGGEALMQIGAPPGMFHRVPWWEHAGLIVPAMVVCIATSLVAAPIWLLGWLRHMARPGSGRRPPAVTRATLLLQSAATLAALWLVFAGWPQVAWSAPVVMPFTLAIYAAAWTGVLLTPIAVWRSLAFARTSRGTRAIVKETVLAAMLVVLGLFSVYWRIAGTTLNL